MVTEKYSLLSSATKNWLQWYEALSDEEKQMMSYRPLELFSSFNEYGTPEVHTPRVNEYDKDGKPIFDKEEWELRLDYANCYAYAMNVILFGEHENLYPGLFSGLEINFSGKNFDEIERLFIVGWKNDIQNGKLGEIIDVDRCDLNSSLAKNEYRVALLFGEYSGHFTYHFLRQDSDGKWSHKPGYYGVFRKDFNDKCINDKNPPHLCNLNFWNNFRGYFKVTHK